MVWGERVGTHEKEKLILSQFQVPVVHVARISLCLLFSAIFYVKGFIESYMHYKPTVRVLVGLCGEGKEAYL
jgi:hypothetical protein